MQSKSKMKMKGTESSEVPLNVAQWQSTVAGEGGSLEASPGAGPQISMNMGSRESLPPPALGLMMGSIHKPIAEKSSAECKYEMLRAEYRL